MKTAIATICLATLSIIGTQSAVGLWSVVTSRLEFPMVSAEIESFRRDLATAPCHSIPMLTALASDWNRRITHEQESNRHWYSDWAVTDQWNQIQRLEMPCHRD